MSQLTMMYLRNFLIVAQLTILFGIVMSAAAPAEAPARGLVGSWDGAARAEAQGGGWREAHKPLMDNEF
jgi:hypothetical protein